MPLTSAKTSLKAPYTLWNPSLITSDSHGTPLKPYELPETRWHCLNSREMLFEAPEAPLDIPQNNETSLNPFEATWAPSLHWSLQKVPKIHWHSSKDSVTLTETPNSSLKPPAICIYTWIYSSVMKPPELLIFTETAQMTWNFYKPLEVPKTSLKLPWNPHETFRFPSSPFATHLRPWMDPLYILNSKYMKISFATTNLSSCYSLTKLALWISLNVPTEFRLSL